MAGYQSTDFSNPCEVLKLYRIYGSYQYEATIFRKPNGEFEIHGACLVRNERKEVWIGGRFRHIRRLKLVTTSGKVVELERRATGDYVAITDGFQLTAPEFVQV